MAFFRERNDPIRILGRRILLIFLAMLVVSALWALWDIFRKNMEATQLRAEAEGRLADLESQQAKLEADIEELETNRGMEAALRQQYAVAGAGEGLIIIVESDKTSTRQASSTPLGWIAKLFHW